MALTPITGFKHFPTHHCVTGSIRHIYEFHDYPISEEMLLGLGSGVGFIYWQMKGTTPFLGGRVNVGEEGMEKSAGRRTGVQVSIHQTESSRKAEKTLLELLMAGEPVMLQVDMGFLPYFDFPEEYHFGGHAIVAAGYDPESRQVLIADREDALYPVSWEDLERARGSKFQPFPPKHRWVTFDFSAKHPPHPDEICQAIHEAAGGMLHPPITNLGVAGIRKAAKRVMNWPAIMTAGELRDACFGGFIFIDATGGTGGGIFRYMYSRFLKESAAITGNESLAEAGEMFGEIGDRWQVVAEIFKQASEEDDPASRLTQVSDLLLEIAANEQTAWEKLYQAVA